MFYPAETLWISTIFSTENQIQAHVDNSMDYTTCTTMYCIFSMPDLLVNPFTESIGMSSVVLAHMHVMVTVHTHGW